MYGKPYFVDTNVWFYGLTNQDRGKKAVADTLLKDSPPRISVQVINELCNNLLKKAQYSETEIKEVIHRLYEICHVLPLHKEVFELASLYRERFSFSYYDSLIVAAAKIGECHVLYTEDMQDGLDVDGMMIKNPFTVNEE